jgi:hypothetical protein
VVVVAAATTVKKVKTLESVEVRRRRDRILTLQMSATRQNPQRSPLHAVRGSG